MTNDKMALENFSSDPNKYLVSQSYNGPDVTKSLSDIYVSQSPFADTIEIIEWWCKINHSCCISVQDLSKNSCFLTCKHNYNMTIFFFFQKQFIKEFYFDVFLLGMDSDTTNMRIHYILALNQEMSPLIHTSTR